MKILSKTDLTVLAKYIKSQFENTFIFPIKLSKALDATSVLLSGVNQQNLLKQIPYNVSSLRVDELQSYLSNVHQRKLDDDEAEYLKSMDFRQELEYVLDAHRTTNPEPSNTAIVMFSLFGAWFADDPLMDDEPKLEAFHPLIQTIKETTGLDICSGSFLQMHPEYMLSEAFNEEWDELFDHLNENINKPSLNIVLHESLGNFGDPIDESDGYSWELDTHPLTYFGLVKLNSPATNSFYQKLESDNGIIPLINNQHGGKFTIGEMSVTVVGDTITNELLDSEETLKHFWHRACLSGNNTRHEWGDYRYGDQFGLSERGLKLLIEESQQKQMFLQVPVVYRNQLMGALVVSPNGDAKLLMTNYEDHYGDLGNLGQSAHHTVGPQIHELFPNTQCYQLQDSDNSSIFMTPLEHCLTLHPANKGMENTQADDILNEMIFAPEQLIAPALYNGFVERVKHWTCGSYNLDEHTHRGDKTYFETHEHELLAAGITSMVVDDFREVYGDYTSVMIVSFYTNDRLIAEVSYSMVFGVPKNVRELKEFMLDKALKEFANKHKLTLRVHDHEVNHPSGERNLQYYESNTGLLPTHICDSYKKSMLVMVIKATLPDSSCARPDANTFDMSKAHALAKPLLRNNVRPVGSKEPEAFKFASIHKPRDLFDSEIEYHQFLSSAENALSRGLETVEMKCGINQGKDQMFIGCYDLEGKPSLETHQMLSNMLVERGYADQSGEEDDDDDFGFLSNSYKQGHELLFSAEERKAWGDVYGVEPEKMTVAFMKPNF